MIISPAQRQELCPAVFGSHDMWYPTEPTRLVFRDAPPYEVLRREFDGVCRRCNMGDTKVQLACSSVVEPRPVKPVVEGSNPSAPAIHFANGSIVELFADVPAVCEPYDNGFAPELFEWESPCGDDCDLCGEW